MSVTDEEITKQQQSIAKLRDRVAEEQAKRDDVLRSADNEITKAQLDAEEKRLQAQLDAAKEETKAAREAVKDAVRAAKGGPVVPESDTTANPTPDGAAVTPTGVVPKTEEE